MVKTVGSFDKRPGQRKRRNDTGKKRTRYDGKPCKHRKPSYYSKSKKGEKDTIKIRPFFRVEMTKDGYANWEKFPWLRAKLYKEVTNMKLSPVFQVKIEKINTKSKIEQWVADNRWEGKFVLMGISNGKTKTHRKWVKICTVVVKKSPNGLVGTMIENKRLSKYRWFYKGS